MDECEHDKVFKKLVKVSKLLLPLIFAAGFLLTVLYSMSEELIDVNVSSKDVEWAVSCVEDNCIEVPIFVIYANDEKFVTDDLIHQSLEINSQYYLFVKGFSFGWSTRRIVEFAEQ